MLTKTHFDILNHLLLIQNWLLIRPLPRKEAIAITTIIIITYVDVANHTCDVVVVDADGDIYIPIK